MKTLLSKSVRSLIYVSSEDDHKKEIWKVSNEEFADKSSLKKEFLITQSFSSNSFRKAIRLSNYHNQQTLILPYIEGKSLKNRFLHLPLSIDDFFLIALKLLKILEDLQRQEIIHNRIHPENIIIDENDTISLIDFSKAEHLPFYYNQKVDLRNASDELSYFSPETTGKLKQKIDYRSDQYSFGVVCFELLTGTLPFTMGEQEDLLYAIVTQPCPFIRWLNSSVPKALEEIIAKLLAKSPDDRYRSIHGIRYDLQLCMTCKNEPEKLLTFIAGKEDWSPELTISQKIYGRESEIKIINDFIGVDLKHTKVAVCLYGKPGTGKSAFEQLVQHEVIKHRAIFISGKFYAEQNEAPFSAIKQALRQLVSSILHESDEALDDWKNLLVKAVGNIGKVLTDFLPDFELIIGKQPEIPLLEGTEALHRINYVFQRLVESVSNQQHPLIIFLDDIENADDSSIAFIQSILSYPKINYFLIIFTSRLIENENVERIFFSNKNEGNLVKKQIGLDNLDESHIKKLVKDSFKIDNVEDFADLISSKTYGNPFFVHQFITLLFANGLLRFSIENQVWEYDRKAINSIPATENVIDYLCSNLEKLPPEYLHYLRVSSCLGISFKLSDLSFLVDCSLDKTQHILEEAAQMGFIKKQETGAYQFSHRNLQNALLIQISKEEQEYLHFCVATLKKGKMDLMQIPPDSLYEIAWHLNLGKKHVTSERIELVEINFLVGQNARKSTAFSLAFEYFEIGIRSSVKDDWKDHYSLLLSLYAQGSETAAILGYRAIAEEWSNIIIEQGKTIKDKIQGYEIKLHILNENHEMAESVSLLLGILKELDFSIKRKPNRINLIMDLIRTKKMFWFKDVRFITKLPEMTDVEACLFMKLTVKCTTSIFSAEPQMLPSIIFKQVQLSIKYGNSPYSPVGYASYGFALSSILGDLNEGYAFGLLSVELANELKAKEIQSKVMTIFYGFLSYWKDDIKEAMHPLKQAYLVGRENGDLLYSSFALTFYSIFLFFSGENLQSVQKNMKDDSLIIKEMNQELVYIISEIQHQFIQSLTTTSLETATITGDEKTEEALIKKLTDKKDSATFFDFYVYKIISTFLAGEYHKAFEYVENAVKYEEETTSRQPTYPYFLLFSVLTASKLFKINKEKRLRKHIKIAAKKLKAMSAIAPNNFESNYFLIMGSLEYVSDRKEKARGFYLKAIQSASKSNFIQEMALAYERLGEMHAEMEEWTVAEMYLKKAYETYLFWGANYKCKKMMETYPEILEKKAASGLSRFQDEPSLEEIIKIGVKLSSDLTLSSFVNNLSKEIVTPVGAERIMIFITENNSLYLKAAGTPGKIQLFNELLDHAKKTKVPVSLLNFINRSKRFFVSGCIYADPKFAKDEYFQTNKIKSVLCLPILKKDKLLGIIYFENNQISDVFDFDKIEFLKILSLQIAVSLENVLLFEQQKKVRELENDYNQNMLIVNNAAEEKERKRISNELHDNIGALLSTIKLYFSYSDQVVQSDINNKISNLLDKTIYSVRMLSHQLSSDIVEEYGLNISIASICKEIEDTGKLKINCQLDFEERLPIHQEINIYRILQELLNNTLKYAEATTICILLKRIDDFLYVEYQDNGIGYDSMKLEYKKGKSLGIQNIKNRAKILKSELSIQSSIGNGFKATLMMTLKKKVSYTDTTIENEIYNELS